MTNSTTELLDFIHTKPGEMTLDDKYTIITVGLDFATRPLLQIRSKGTCVHMETYTHMHAHKKHRIPNLAPSAREQIVLMGLMSRHDVTVK